MNAAFERRISIASCWAASRVALLDSVERYEDSYSINQEFCEWVAGINNHSHKLEQSLMKVPDHLSLSSFLENSDADEVLEI